LFKDDAEIAEYLKSLPRYQNNSTKSGWYRARFFLSLLWARMFDKITPLFVVLVTNNQCNLNCEYCYGGYGERKAYTDYTLAQLLGMIDELKRLGTTLLTMHGGESLMYPHIGEVLNYTKLKGFYIGFNTNGYMVPRMIDQIKVVDTLCLSLDGREEHNDKLRGKGCYNKVMKAMDACHEAGIPLVVSATLTKDTKDDMEFLAELAVEKNFRLQYSILYNYESESIGEVEMTDDEIRETTQKILDLKHQGFPIYYSDNVLETTIEWPQAFDKRFFTKNDIAKGNVPEDAKLIPCYHGKLKYQIDADGRVVVCWAHNNKNAPNVLELGVEGALKACHDKDFCEHCSFLANNEHNALMDLSAKNVWQILKIHVSDMFKVGHEE